MAMDDHRAVVAARPKKAVSNPKLMDPALLIQRPARGNSGMDEVEA